MTKAKKPVKRGVAYVYGLIDPRTGAMFYVGKGTGYRLNQHEGEARRGKLGAKNEKIREILSCGLRVECRVLEEFDTDAEAYVVEKALIAEHRDSLTNLNSGGGGGFGLGAYSYFKARAQKSLDRLRPFAEWRAWLGARWSDVDFRVLGTPEEFYARMRAELMKEASDPSPNVLTIGPDGKGVFGWEF